MAKRLQKSKMQPATPSEDTSKLRNTFRSGLMKHGASFSRPQLTVFVLVFGLIGFIIYRSFAAAPLVATLEAEQMSLAPGGVVVNDSAASGGRAMMLSSNGTTSGSVNFPSSVNSVTIIAKGDQCQGSPAMTVALDGTALLSNAAVSSSTWSSFSATPGTAINSGTHNLSISFSNDYTKNKGNPRNQCSRSLYIDVSNFYGPTPTPTPAPTVSLSATPSSVTTGQASTLTWNSTNATSCTASGAWSGSQPTSGSISTGALNQNSTYTLTCTGAGGSASASANVIVGAGVPAVQAATVTHTTDGNLNEADWDTVIPISKSVIGSANNSSSFGAVWDNTYLYIGVRVMDSSLKNDSTNCWDDDTIEVYLDPNNSGGTTYSAYDKQLSKSWNDSSLCGNSASTTPGVQHGWASISGGYTTEMAIPWSSLGVTPTSGMIVGVDVSYDDDDDGAARDSQAVWNGTAFNYTDPSGFGDLALNGTPIVTTPPPATSGGPAWGYSAHILRMSDQANYIQLAVNGGANTLRDDFEWYAIEPSQNSWNWTNHDSIMRQTAQAGINVLAMAGYGASWSTGCNPPTKCGPLNNADYADFVAHIAQRYGRNGTFWTANPSLPYRPLVGIEIWNEPNIGFWQNPNPAKYTAMLKAAYPAIKNVDPNMTVISAGLAPQGGYNDWDCNGVADSGYDGSSKMNQINFMQGMYANGAAGYMDAVGYHPYNFPGNGTAAGMLSYHLCSGWSQMSGTPLSIRSLMTSNGDGAKKVWATELGAPTSGSGAVSESAQADLATQIMTLWKSYSWAGGFYWYDLRDDCTNTADRECSFGAVRYNNSLKPSYGALKTAWQ